jgi:hypothetical protein
MGMLVNPYRFGGAVVSYSFVASAITSTSTCALPTGSQAGDIAVLFGLGIKNSSTPIPDDSYPAGWFDVATATGSGLGGNTAARMRVSAKILDASDITAGSVTAAMANATSIAYGMLAFRPSRAVATLSKSTWSGEVTAGDPASQTVASGSVTGAVLVFGFTWDGDNGAPAFSTATPAFDGTVSPSSSRLVGYSIHNSSPVDHTIDSADNGRYNGLMSGWLQAA